MITIDSLAKGKFGLDHGFDAVVHILDKIDFGSTKSAQVGDVVDAIVALGVLSVGATNLDVVLVSDCLELVFFLG